MTITTIAFSAIGSVLLLLSGYIWGAKQGKDERETLRNTLEERERELTQLRDAQGPQFDALRAHIDTVLQPLTQGVDQSKHIEQDLKQIMDSLSLKQEHDASIKHTLENVLAPMVERERRQFELSQIPAEDISDRRGLPLLLDAISEKGGFSTVLPSDEVGLPLAASKSSEHVDIISGMSALLLSLFERIAKNGMPMPSAAVFRDEANQIIVHRAFQLRDEQYVLTAVNKGNLLAPDALDPALTSIEQALNREAWDDDASDAA